MAGDTRPHPDTRSHEGSQSDHGTTCRWRMGGGVQTFDPCFQPIVTQRARAASAFPPPRSGTASTRPHTSSISTLISSSDGYGLLSPAAPLQVLKNITNNLRNTAFYTVTQDSMPRAYKCRKCGIHHEPPTGKHCRMSREISDDETPEHDIEAGSGSEVESTITTPDWLPMFLEMKGQMEMITEQMGTMRQTNNTNTANSLQPYVAPPTTQGATGGASEQPDNPSDAQSLRQDLRLMSQAAKRLAQLQLDDSDDEDLAVLQRSRNTGKKSGSVLTPTDKVKKQIDWPHMHINRITGGNSIPVSYGNMRTDEFVYGFLCMIDSAECKWDYRTMTRILKHLMQEAMEFSWSNALNFYRLAGLAVERGEMQWSDEPRLHEMRMTYARAVFPTVRESKEAPRTQLLPAPSNMRCCVPFQHHACEQDRDHAPFTHGCAYCLKARSALCRHPEDDCKRKSIDTKNGKAREQ